MCQVAKYLKEQAEECRDKAKTQGSQEWAQVSLKLQREQAAHADRCQECKK